MKSRMIFYKDLFIILSLLIVFNSEKCLAQIHTDDEGDPCEPYNPILPDFSMPGRRTSVVKCHEYVWQIVTRLKTVNKKQECIISKCPDSSCIGGGIGGRDTTDEEFPHMAAIGWRARNRKIGFIFKCCGSLISEQFVLTAGHCVQAVVDTEISDPIPKIVRVGNKNIANLSPHEDIAIVDIIPHYNYRPPKKYYDIALMKIAEPIEFSYYIQPACLLVDEAVKYYGPAAIATGWGITELGGKPSEKLQAVNLDLLDSEFCDPLLSSSCNRHWCGLQDHQICAANLSGGVDTCSGDSGGPLQIELRPFPKKYRGLAKMYGIVGITSFGVKCALKNSPGIYTRVSYFLDWIEDIVWPSEKRYSFFTFPDK